MQSTKYVPGHVSVAKALGGYEQIVDRFVSMHLRRVNMPEMVHRLCRFVLWTRGGMALIRDQEANVVPLHLNPIQSRLCAVMLLQAAQMKPIRLVILKARKGGTTTYVESLMFHLCAHYTYQIGTMMAHVASSTVEIFGIARLLAETYALGARSSREMLFFPATRSQYSCHTAGGVGAGAGGTPTALHLSEVGLMIPRVKAELYSSTASVADNASTIVVQESTARGREKFFDTFSRAHQVKHPYEPVFIPWFLDSRLTARIEGKLGREVDEQILCAMAANDHGVEIDDNMLQWRRTKIDDLGLALFKQEFPATPEEAIEGHKGLILSGIRACVIDELPFNPATFRDSLRKGGMDFGYADPTVFVRGFYVDQAVYVAHVYHAVGKLSREHGEHVERGVTYYCDPSALQARKDVEDAMYEHGVLANLESCPRIRDERRANTTNDAEWELVRRTMKDGRLKILASCAEQILVEADNFAVNEKTGQPNETRNPGVWYHFDTLDALRYMVVGTMMNAEVGTVVIRR